MLKITVYSDPVVDEAGVITEEKRELRQIFFNKEDIMRVVYGDSEAEEGKETTKQLVIFMKHKVKDVRRFLKKNQKSEIVMRGGKPIVVEEVTEDFDMYFVTEPDQIEYLLKAIV